MEIQGKKSLRLARFIDVNLIKDILFYDKLDYSEMINLYKEKLTN